VRVRRCTYRYMAGKIKERDHLEELGENGRILLSTLKGVWNGLD